MSSMSSPASPSPRFWPYLLCLIFVWGVNNPSSSFHIDWDDFHRSRARDLTWYLHYLSAHEPTDTPESPTYQRRLEYKKSAIGYILATGGPNGFREEPATDEEEIILLKAASVAAFLHESLGGVGDFDLLSIRRSNGWDTETNRIKSHLLFVQKPLTATRVLIKAGQNLSLKEFVGSVRYLYRRDFLPTLGLGAKVSPDEQLKAFTQVFTKELAAKTRESFEDIMGPVSTAYANSVPLVCYAENLLQNHIDKICRQESGCPEVDSIPIDVTLKNGLIVSRNERGVLTLKSSCHLNLGRVSFSPRSVYRAPIVFHSGPLLISKYQDEDALLASLEAVSAILTGDTRKKGSQVPISNVQMGGFYDDF